jgi:hypothetical protein
MYTEQAYVRTTEELLQRIDAFDVRQSAQDIMATAWRERDSKGWEFVWEPRPLNEEEQAMVSRYAHLVRQRTKFSGEAGYDGPALAREIEDLRKAFEDLVSDDIEHYRHFAAKTNS